MLPRTRHAVEAPPNLSLSSVRLSSRITSVSYCAHSCTCTFLHFHDLIHSHYTSMSCVDQVFTGRSLGIHLCPITHWFMALETRLPVRGSELPSCRIIREFPHHSVWLAKALHYAVRVRLILFVATSLSLARAPILKCHAMVEHVAVVPGEGCYHSLPGSFPDSSSSIHPGRQAKK